MSVNPQGYVRKTGNESGFDFPEDYIRCVAINHDANVEPALFDVASAFLCFRIGTDRHVRLLGVNEEVIDGFQRMTRAEERNRCFKEVRKMIDLSKVPNLIRSTSAHEREIQEVETVMKTPLPAAYKELLRYTNGFSIGGGLLIYGTEEIVERNEAWETEEYASGYVAIGDDGGGNVLLMLQGPAEKEVFIVDSGDMNPNHAALAASDFIKWVTSGGLIETDDNLTTDLPETCRIVLVKAPDGGLKDLVKIKNGLGIDLSTAELLKASKNPPCTLAENFPYGKGKKRIEQLGQIGSVLNALPTCN